MPNRLKLVIDSVVEDRVRILTTTRGGKKREMDVDFRALSRILGRKERVVEGGSYSVIFQNNADYKMVMSGKVDKRFKPKGNIRVKDTTEEDKAAIERLQKRLGLRI